ncbi:MULTISPECIES: ATP-binding protein [Flavobacterium]|uniref:ATP-binding protein n=1 Tax=Flavobacterium gawalongense TaxID=2594432 RepID=A0A553BX74_9FLAO|nr:ATP-binding protein [Flavobacterium gawalongense]TRX04291.1 ATP-binding protein [Flavobacterium gawalongense]TRX09261.1 ATP-binding protein [Flavobacterium gawalongense]TRX12927.1 ATP-binding protein [Flavobacterium gawalongense]TRX13271.1 ATP-binding protein [Flavobacterium gawalongense]TRX30667.1 ATP-binding protein [Flavobacterium gawalongense]
MLEIARKLKDNLLEKWNSGKVLIVIGPRQVGKTTLIKSLCEAEGNYLFINGDDPEDRLLLENAGENKLRSIIGNYKTIFFDEAQRIRNIGMVLKIINDQIKGIRLVVSGSSALDITNEINEPLTGRKWEFNLFPFSWHELQNHFGYMQNAKNLPRYMIYGMYPEVITNFNDAESVVKQIAGSYLYKDLLQYQGIRKPEVLDKLLLALALQLGSEVNYNELSRTVGVDRATVEQYISLLEKAFVVFRLQPLSRNVRNEMNTSRKIYFYDNGIRNAIIGNFKSLEFRQDIGALWENFIISERIKFLNYNNWYGRFYFWRTYQQQEIDWIEEIDGAFSAFEFKWNTKKSNKAFPKTFIDNYAINKTLVVTPENIDDFLV